MLWVFLSLAFITTGCNQASPQKYFDIAILNSNLMADFAGNGLLRQLEKPSSKLSESGAVVSMSRTEVIELRIGFIEENFEKVKNLPVTEETKDMVNASIALYEFVLPVYKNEYRDLAKLYDGNASQDQIQINAQTIHDKYAARFGELHSRLMTLGKPYAERNNILVNWDVKTSPSF